MKIALGIEYDGGYYHGWQRQPGLATVQGFVEAALSKVANQPIEVVCAGRTDTGVHATEQVVHFESSSQRNSRSWILGVNSNLPKNICVRWAKPVDEKFHARFSAVLRRYRYLIYNHHIRPGIQHANVTWNYRPLDERRMAEAAEFLVGEHDFTSYRALQCQAKSPVRVVKHLDVERSGDFISVDITANAFLHHMVRNIVGVLIDIGAGKQQPIWAKEVLDHRDRTLGGVTAPPYGLYLVQITYPEEFALPKGKVGPLFIGG